jgi:death-on-curing protein
VNQYLYDKNSDFTTLAAAYGFGIAKNHPFIDGNKRTAFLCIGLFLALNNKHLRADPADAIRIMLALAAGTLDEAALAAWIRDHSARARIGR